MVVSPHPPIAHVCVLSVFLKVRLRGRVFHHGHRRRHPRRHLHLLLERDLGGERGGGGRRLRHQYVPGDEMYYCFSYLLHFPSSFFVEVKCDPPAIRPAASNLVLEGWNGDAVQAGNVREKSPSYSITLSLNSFFFQTVNYHCKFGMKFKDDFGKTSTPATCDADAAGYTPDPIPATEACVECKVFPKKELFFNQPNFSSRFSLLVPRLPLRTCWPGKIVGREIRSRFFSGFSPC